jgi:hypothetical protein
MTIRCASSRGAGGIALYLWARLMLVAAGLAWAASLAACGDDTDSASGDGAPDALVGGWTNAADHLLACFAADGRMWLGDSSTEIGGTSYCALTDDGAHFHCSAREDNAAFDGALALAAGELTLAIAPCPPSSEGDCSASYQRDSSVRCE